MPRGHVLTASSFMFSPRFSPDGRHVIVQTGGTLERWEVATGKPAGAKPDPRKGFEVAATPDGKRSLTLEQGRGLVCINRLYDEAGRLVGEPIKLPATLRRPLNEPSFSPDGRLVLGRDGNVTRLWDSATGKRLGVAFDHGGEIQSTAISPDGSILATGGADGLVRLWDASSGQRIGAPIRHKGPVESLTFSPDGGRLLAGENPPAGRKMRAWLWDVKTGGQLGDPIGHSGGIPGAPVFSPDGRRLLGAADRDTARQWDARTGKPIPGLMFHGRQMDSFAYSPDGVVVATAGLAPSGDDGRFSSPEQDGARVRFWDAGTGRPIGSAIMLEKAGNSKVRFSADGRTLLAGNANELRLLPTPRQARGDGERVRLWIEVSTGLTMDAGGAVVRLDAGGWQQKQKRIEALGGAP
jgi:WD40 repeat protein